MADSVPMPARKKRTLQEIRDSKTSGEKMVYMSVPDYTSAKWAEMAGVDVAVLGDSLAMIAHGHSSTIPATMDMMALHAQAVRTTGHSQCRNAAAEDYQLLSGADGCHGLPLLISRSSTHW